jgi:hypothetical protein
MQSLALEQLNNFPQSFKLHQIRPNLKYPTHLATTLPSARMKI